MQAPILGSRTMSSTENRLCQRLVTWKWYIFLSPLLLRLLIRQQALEFGAYKLWNVEFISIFTLSSERSTPVHIELDGHKWAVKSASPADQANNWPFRVSDQGFGHDKRLNFRQYDRVHAAGFLSLEQTSIREPSHLQLSEIRNRLKPIDMQAMQG